MNQNDETRPTPQAVESEAAILGAILRDNNLQRVAAGRLEASSFYIRNNGKLWGILPDLIAQAGGQGVDACGTGDVARGRQAAWLRERQQG